MKTIFPQTESKNWVQQNKGDLYPVLYSTRNINLEKRGYIGLSRRMSYIKKDTGLSGISPAIIGNSAQSQYKFISGTKIFDVNYGFTTVAEDTNATTAGFIGHHSDLIVYNGRVWYTPTNGGSSSIYIYYRSTSSTGAYSTLAPSLTLLDPHPMAVFTNKNLLCVAQANVIATINTSDTINSTALTLPAEYSILGMQYLNNKMYIATIKGTENKAMMFEWDGATAISSTGYEVGAKSILAMCVYQESIVILTSRGELLRFGGGGFTQIATLPFFQNKDYSWYFNNSYTFNVQAFKNAMVVEDEYLYINLQNTLIYNNALTLKPEFLNGIYQYHKDFGLVHKFSPSQSTSASITDYGQAYALDNPVLSTLQEASISYPNSPTLATGVRFLTHATLLNPDLTSSSYLQSITSGEARGDFVTSKIYTLDTTAVNQKLFVKFKNLIDSTDKIIVKVRSTERNNYPFVLPSNNTYAVTWTSTTTFTSTNSFFTNVRVDEEVFVLTGNGAGSLAHITSIVDNAGTYTITLDEAITGVVNGNKSGIVIDNWQKVKTITYTNTDGHEYVGIGTNGKYIQIKIELRGANEPMIEELTLLTEGEIKAK